MKQRAEDAIKVHAESLKKNVQGSPKVFDPAVSILGTIHKRRHSNFTQN